MNIRFIFFVILILSANVIMGQNRILDMTLAKDFDAQVKSVDEFIARFNGEETKPGIASDSFRRDNLLALFDFNMPHKGLNKAEFKSSLTEFVRSVMSWNGKLSVASKGIVADAYCSIKYKSKTYHISLLLQREKTESGNQRWAIMNVKGLESLGLFNNKRATLSPVDHETHFMSLQDYFQSNRNLVSSLRSKDKDIDQLSFFFGMVVSKGIDFDKVDELKFYFFDVPNYVFRIEEIGRKGTNSGWLITDYVKVIDSQKREYFDKLFNTKEK